MDKKCSKYESYFVFSDSETFKTHIEECSDCKAVHEKMQKVSDLIQETKFYYKIKFKRKQKLKAICALAVFMFFSFTFQITHINEDFSDILMYGDTLTAEDLGFPVDSYGLLMVDDEF